MRPTAWQETIEQTQSLLLAQPDHCFVCEELVPVDCHKCAVQAFRDAEHTQRLAVVCARTPCLRALTDARTGLWTRLYQALEHWPEPALYPLGPYWTVQRAQQFTLRTAQRRTALLG